MADPYDLIFNPGAFGAEIVFVGTRCGNENLHSDYATGCMHFVREGRARLELAGGQAWPVEEPSLVFVPRGVRHVLEGLFAELHTGRPGSRQLADRLCTVVLAYVARHVHEQSAARAPGTLFAASADHRIATALATIHARYHEPLNLDRLAQACGMSRSRFAALFSRAAGVTPHDYLVSYRIGMAQQLLARGLPVKTVALRVGYATTSAFVRKFRQVVGVPPGAWTR